MEQNREELTVVRGDGAALRVGVGDVVAWGEEREFRGIVRYFTADLRWVFVEQIGGRRGVYQMLPADRVSLVVAAEAG